MRRFLVTGMGRSGTMWLSRVLGTAPGWRVLHEPAGKADALPGQVERIQERFDDATEPYGEVNSHLRHHACNVRVDAYGLLLRDPAEVWVSIANRKPERLWAHLLADYEASVDAFFQLARRNGAVVIDFHRAVRNPRYLGVAAECLMATEWEVPKSVFEERCNHTAAARFHSLAEFPAMIRRRVDVVRREVNKLIGGA